MIPVSQMYTGTSILLIALYGYGTFNVLVALVFEVTVLECLSELLPELSSSFNTQETIIMPINKIQNIFKRVSPLNADASVAQGGSV